MAKPTAPIVILLIQGNRRTGESVEPLLRKQGYEVVRAATGKDAMNRVKSQRPAVAVFDSSSWRGSCVRLCSDLCDANVPVLVLTFNVKPCGTQFLQRLSWIIS